MAIYSFDFENGSNGNAVSSGGSPDTAWNQNGQFVYSNLDDALDAVEDFFSKGSIPGKGE